MVYFCDKQSRKSSDGQAFSLVARLAAKQQTGVAPLSRYITAHGPPT